MKNLFSLILIAMIMFTAVGFAEPLAGSWMPSGVTAAKQSILPRLRMKRSMSN